MATDDAALHEQMVRDVLRMTSELDLSASPPVTGQKIHRRLRELTGWRDPYAAVKTRFNRMALEMLPELREQVARAEDPFTAALRLAIAGNVIDLGVNGAITEDDVRAAIASTLDEPFEGDIDAFREPVRRAGNILYLADNAGEIVLDRLLVEQLAPAPVTVAVRGAPVINDATRADALLAGMDEVSDLIDNGSDAPATLLGDCSEAFRRRFAEADVVIAKGQGNYESLSNEHGNIFFLFKAKCPVIAEHAGVPVGTHMLMRRNGRAARGNEKDGAGRARPGNREGERKHMKIAVPTANGKLAAHFGHCDVFTLVETDPETNAVKTVNEVTPPPHEPGVLPQWLREQGAEVIIAGGMGRRAQMLFAENGIEVIVGAPVEAPDVLVTAYLDGALETGANLCDH